MDIFTSGMHIITKKTTTKQNKQQWTEAFLTHPSFCGGIGTLPSLFSFDSTAVTFTPPFGCQTFFTFSTKPAVSFLSKNSSMLLFFTRNSAWYRGISAKQNYMALSHEINVTKIHIPAKEPACRSMTMPKMSWCSPSLR